MVAGQMAESIEMVVVGGGPGGYTAAARAAELGKQVLLVERGALGGVCLNVGCIPSKALITIAHDMARVAAGAERGFRADLTLDFAATQTWKQQTIDRLVAGVTRMLSKVKVVNGTARFLDANRISVEVGDQVEFFDFESAIIATGSEPIEVSCLPFDHSRIVDSTGALAFEELPASLAVVGGGYIGTELGMAYARMGVTVTIVEAMDRILAGFDTDLAKVVATRAKELGITVYPNTQAKGVDDTGLLVTGPDGDGRVDVEKILVAVGRRPLTSDLQLDMAGVNVESTGHVGVDEQCRTNVKGIYAIGDVTPGPALAHRAMAQGRVAAEVIVGQPSAADFVVPLIAFTDPEVASVGLTESDAKAQGLDYVVGKSRFAASGRALVLGEDVGFVKMLTEAGSGIVLGVHIVGPNASDLIGAGAIAVENAVTAEDVASGVQPHPTLVESIQEAAIAVRRRSG